LKSNRVLLAMLNGRLSRRATIIASATLLVILIIPSIAPAASLSGDSSTYVQSRQAGNDDRILGAYEYLDFDVQKVGDETISFHSGGWLRYDFKEEEFGKKSNNDLQYSYLSFKSKTDNTIVNLGRVMVFEGVAAERVDGIYARTDLMYGFGISAFGGAPVETNTLDTPNNDVIYGGRLSQEKTGLYRVGVSLLREERDGDAVRKEEGFDLWFQPFSTVEISGSSKYNVMADDWHKLEGAKTSDWANHNYYVMLGPFSNVRLKIEDSSINYKNYFTASTTTVFSFQPGVLDPNEQVDILGETIFIDIATGLNLSLDYKTYAYEIAGDAKYIGGNLRYTDTSRGAGLSLHKMDGDTARLRYSEYRVYGYKKIDKTDIALDVLDLKYAEPVNNVSNAYSVSLALGYDLSERLKVGADFEYSKNPDFDKDVRAFVKAIYKFDIGSGAKKEGA
jgi:hypothetical protein